MQPVRITPVDKLLTALLSVRRQTVYDCLPAAPGFDHVFAVAAADGTLSAVYRVSALTPLPADYLQALRLKGFTVKQREGSALTRPRPV